MAVGTDDEPEKILENKIQGLIITPCIFIDQMIPTFGENAS